MSHPHQAYGGEYQPQQQQQSTGQQDQFLNPQLANTHYEAWQQYYSQIAPQQQRLSLISQSPIGQPILQPQTPPHSLIQSQQNPQQQYNLAAAPTAPMRMSSTGLVSLQQQYFQQATLLAQQQQHYLHHQQMLNNQQHQQSFVIPSSQMQQHQQNRQIVAQQPQNPPQQVLSSNMIGAPLPVTQQQHHNRQNLEKWDVDKELGLKEDIPLKSPPTSAENVRILKEREETVAAERLAIEEGEKQRVQEELKKQRMGAKEAAQIIKERFQSFPEPIHLATFHTLSKVSAFLPFPAEVASTSTNLRCFDINQVSQVLTNTDASLSDYLATLLSDTTDELRQIVLKHNDEESSDLEGITVPIPPLLGMIQGMNSFAFNTDPLDEDEEAQSDIQEAVERMNSDAGMVGMAVAMFTQQQDKAVFVSGSSTVKQIQDENVREKQQAVSSKQRMVASIGKPKFGGGGRRKKDMVESLYDSLTGYFDPGSKGQRRRRSRACHNGGEDDDDYEVSSTTSNERFSEEPECKFDGTENAMSVSTNQKSRKRGRIAKDFAETEGGSERKFAKLAHNRPPTPTEVIQQREHEWQERQRQREEKYKKRRQQQENGITGGQLDSWSVDVIAENDSFCKFSTLVDQVLEQMDEALNQLPSTSMIGEENTAGLLLERGLVESLRMEAQKLKSWQKLHEMPIDRLIKLLTILEKNIRDVLTENGELSVLVKASEDDEWDDTLRDIIDDRLLRSVDAALVALCIMTSKKMPKQVLVEDVIERSIQLCKQCLQEVIYPAVDPVLKSQNKGSHSRKSAIAMTNLSAIQKRGTSRGSFTNLLYTRLVELLHFFSELACFQPLNETLLVALSSLGTPPFFVENVTEVQMQAIKLLPTIFAKCPSLRKNLLFDLLNSLHRLPLTRNIRNSYRLSATESIGNFTVLILQLIQSAVHLPIRKGHNGNESRSRRAVSADEESDDLNDRQVLDTYEDAKRMAAFFLGGFLAKCTARSEDDYRKLFEQFLQDLLIALYRPLWPVTEMILTILGNLLVVHFRSKNYDLSLRVASMEYLGVIAARLRKDRVQALSADASVHEKEHLNSIVRAILFDEYAYDPNRTDVDEIDISHLSSSEKVRKLEQGLFDYIIWVMWDGDMSVEYVLMFYAVEWYRETVLDVEVVKERYQKAMAEGAGTSQKERQKFEEKLTRIIEKGASMKTFITGLMDKQHLKRRMQMLVKTGNVIVESDSHWIVKFLASKKELSQSFDVYLKKILEGFNPDLYPVAIRAKAMKCLAQIVEADYQVLLIPEVNKIVQDRLIDANASVREATFDLIGKCLVLRPDLLDNYYSILINRTKDTAVAVRKRVLRILRDIVFSRKNYERRSQILSEVIQRINDEESVKKLCMETFQQLWFQPVNMREEGSGTRLVEKISLLVETARYCVSEGSIEHFDTLVFALVKQRSGQEPGIVQATKQIVDALVDFLLEQEKKVAHEQNAAAAVLDREQDQQQNESEIVNLTKDFQQQLFAALTLLSFFAKARPEMLIRHIGVFVPYLSVSGSGTLEFRVLNQIIAMLEQIIPLMDAQSVAPTLIKQLDQRLNEIARDGGMLLIASSISCMSALYARFKLEEQPSICRLFIVYFKYLEKLKRESEQWTQTSGQGPGSFSMSAEKKPNLLRALYSIGLMGRYFDFDDLLGDAQRQQIAATFAVHASSNGNSSSHHVGREEGQQQQIAVVRTAVFSLLFHFSRSQDTHISQKALIAMGQLSAGWPELLRREELKTMYMVLLNTDKRSYLQLKVQVLKNIASFLLAEEQKALRRAEHAKKEREQKAAAAQDDLLDLDNEENSSSAAITDDLKEMELSSSGLSSSIIQQYWTAILNCYFHSDDTIRLNSAQVIRQTLEQGLVTPGSSVPTLVAMSTDPIAFIRSRVENLIRDMNTKYKGMILSKAIPGVRMSFQLQKKVMVRSDSQRLIRGIRRSEIQFSGSGAASKSADKNLPIYSNDSQAFLGNFYTSIRAQRQQRRSFLGSLLKLFSEDYKEKVDRGEWVYLADNLAHFPYAVLDEPLYVIYQANAIISVSGQSILSQFRQLLDASSGDADQMPMPKVHQQRHPGKRKSGVTSADTSGPSLSTAMEEMEEFSVEYIMERLPEDRVLITELKTNSQACFLLLHLKMFLMRMYGLKEDKIAEYSPSEAVQVYEKTITRRNIRIFSPDFILNELTEGDTESAAAPSNLTFGGEERGRIAVHFHKFHEMLLSLDERKDDEEGEETGDDGGGAGATTLPDKSFPAVSTAPTNYCFP